MVVGFNSTMEVGMFGMFLYGPHNNAVGYPLTSPLVPILVSEESDVIEHTVMLLTICGSYRLSCDISYRAISVVKCLMP